MPCPFPGMDPYLEHPSIWPDVHNRLIVFIADDISPQIRPNYYVALEERVYVAEHGESEFIGRPDVTVVGRSETRAETSSTRRDSSVRTVQVPYPDEVRETYLEVRETSTDFVVTVMEILSPSNKRPGRGRILFEDKRMDVLATRTHLVEIDLIRAWEPMHIIGNGIASDYRILVSRGNHRPNATLYTFGVRQPIPTFPLPLRRDDDGPVVNLGELPHDLYDRAGYDLRIDYSTEPEPPLSASDAAWADELLRQKERR